MPVTKDNAHDVITYSRPSEVEVQAITEIRGKVEDLILTILDKCPNCADQQAAIRKVREAMMTANAAIVLRGLV